MKSLNARPLFALCFLVQVNVSIGMYAQPVNDDFADRITLTGGAVLLNADAKNAGVELEEPASMIENGMGSLWWDWTATDSGRYTISTAGSDLDTVLGVYTGETLESLNLVAFNDDEDLIGGVFTSRLTFFAIAGTRYSFAVAALIGSITPGEEAPFQLSIAPSATESLEPWSLKTIDDDLLFDSEALPGNLIIIDFWATWCVPCRAEIPIFNELQGTYGDRGLTVLGVSVDTVGVSEILAFASQLPVEFPIALSSASLEELLGGVASIPTAFIIDAENNLITRHVGFKDRDFWFNEVESLIAPQSIAVPSPELQIRVFGEPTHIELSWVSEFSNWALQATSNPGIGWTTIDVEMGSESENQSVQVDTEGKLFQFFRIVQN